MFQKDRGPVLQVCLSVLSDTGDNEGSIVAEMALKKDFGHNECKLNFNRRIATLPFSEGGMFVLQNT